MQKNVHACCSQQAGVHPCHVGQAGRNAKVEIRDQSPGVLRLPAYVAGASQLRMTIY